MISLNFDLESFKNSNLFKKPVLIKNGFSLQHDFLKEFYQILLNPLNGSHNNLVKVMHEGNSVNSEAWGHAFPGDSGCYRDSQALIGAIKLKSSIIFDQYYRYSHEAKELVSFVQEQFNCISACNAYLSQKGSKAFSIHRDCHHVLIFSLSGQKRWQIYNKKQSMLSANQLITSSFTANEIIDSGLAIDEIAEPGDVLYIPIGQFHAVENISNNALHLSVSMRFRSLASLLEDVLQEIYDLPQNHPLSDQAYKIINDIHPVHTQAKPLDENALLTAFDDLHTATREIIRQSDFIEKQNIVKKNKHLKIFTTPADETIAELVKCLE